MSRGSILFVSKGVQDASTRYRALAYFEALRSDGWTPSHLSASVGWTRRRRLLSAVARAEVVVVQRKTFNPIFSHLLRRRCRHLIYDLDDAVFCRSDGSPSSTRAKRFARMVRDCRQVWAGNTYLAEKVREYNSSVCVLPTSLAPDKYTVEIEKPDRWIDLVWIGSRSTRRYLEPAVEIIEGLTQRLPNLRLKIIADFDLPSDRLNTVPVAWSESAEASELAASHIGIAPMPETDWTRGKCALKVIQYMAAGLPVVSSPVGVNREAVLHGKTGFLADSPEQWQAAILKLAQDPGLRDKMGREGRRRAVQTYSIQSTFPKMSAALKEVCN